MSICRPVYPPDNRHCSARLEPQKSARNGREQTQQIGPLFNHLIGEQLDRVGHLETKCPGRLQVDHKLEFGGLCDRQVGGLHALEDLTGVDTDLTNHVWNIGPIAHQPTGFDKITLV
jgi:hypothetical protein